MKNIIVTIGPSSARKDILEKLKLAGANRFRINLSHANFDSIKSYFNLFKSVDIVPSIDTQGAQLRITDISSKEVFQEGEKINLIFGNSLAAPLNKKFIRINHFEAFEQIEIGDIVKLDIEGLAVECKQQISPFNYESVVIASGKALLNRAVDVTSKKLDLSVLTDFDKKAIEYSLSNGCKEVYASFISNEKQVQDVRRILSSEISLISKIETLEGVENAREISKLSNEILIDRGDLSRETTIPMVPIATSKTIKVANQSNTPVNVATNVLDSMMNSNIPSRAEVSDIYSLLKAGVSGIVLAAEVAIGNNPVQTTALLKYLINNFENIENGSTYKNKLIKPSHELIGKELYNWL